jgi:hypothetical protein
MKNIFTLVNIKTLLKLNIVSIIIIAFCEVFAFSVFFAKGFQEGIERWKFISLIAVVVIITLLFAGSIVSFIYFIKMKNKNNH